MDHALFSLRIHEIRRQRRCLSSPLRVIQFVPHISARWRQGVKAM